MMHDQSHQARWQYIPLAAPRLTRWQRLLRWLDDLFAPVATDQGRRRIDPALPYGHWAAGWEGPVVPGQKKSPR